MSWPLSLKMLKKKAPPTYLGDKRLEGSAFPKSIRGSTPKIKDQCQIERAAKEAETEFRFYLSCPHCGKKQSLKWGGKDASFGTKWDAGKPDDAWYLCEHNACVIRQHELSPLHEQGEWRCDKTGLVTKDGMEYFRAGQLVETPDSVTWYVWTAYSPFTTWGRIVRDFINAKDDPGKLKTFVNTTLGETWDDETGEKLEWENLYARREHYLPAIPDRAVYIAGSVDTQDDRLEGKIKAYGPGEESWLIDYVRLIGDPSGEVLWQKLTDWFDRTFDHASGVKMPVGLICIDSGGHYTDEVYAWCRHDPMRRIPIKGASIYGKPVATFPRKRNRKGVYLTEVGTDNAKDIIYSRLAVQAKDLDNPIRGYMHLPIAEWADEAYFKGLTAERKTMDFSKGRRIYRWVCRSGVRNEPTDLEVYNLAAVRIAQQHFGLDLEKARPEGKKASSAKKRKSVHKSSWL
ncbi:terminase gpA endonuclease subunit [Endozoicomonas lisbonensis]|uniref:terminase gpA endonuclease subunit n=1 Tax=Endozoicomonas lisbonensis TaxID=3120522 RepID=UPI0033975369